MEHRQLSAQRVAGMSCQSPFSVSFGLYFAAFVQRTGRRTEAVQVLEPPIGLPRTALRTVVGNVVGIWDGVEFFFDGMAVELVRDFDGDAALAVVAVRGDTERLR